MQKLILPINKAKLTASMKTQAYLSRFGYVHYGVDMVSTAGDRTLYASGDGVVLATGKDRVVGRVIAVLYTRALNRTSGGPQDVVLRCFHLEGVQVKPGQRVNKDTVLGVYGNTGSMSMAYHLHLEADADIAHPLYSPTVLRSDFLRGRAMGATDSTMHNPLDFLHCKVGPPDNQTYTTAGDIYIKSGDRLIGSVA